MFDSFEQLVFLTTWITGCFTLGVVVHEFVGARLNSAFVSRTQHDLLTGVGRASPFTLGIIKTRRTFFLSACMPLLPPPRHPSRPEGRVRRMPCGVRTQPRPLAGVALSSGDGTPPRLTQGRDSTAPPTPKTLPHAAPLHP